MKHLKLTIEDGKAVTLAEAQEIDGEVYSLPLDLDALTLGQAQTIVAYLDGHAPDEYKDLLAGRATATEEVYSSTITARNEAILGAIATITGMPATAFSSLDYPTQCLFANSFESNVIAPLYVTFRPQGIESFEFEGVTYLAPRKQADGVGGELPFTNITTEEYCEANDIVAASRHPMENAHLLVAILCRPEGEVYNELTVRARAERFKALPTSTAYEVFFCKVAQMVTSQASIMKYFSAMVEAAKAKNKRNTKGSRCKHGAAVSTSPSGRQKAPSRRRNSRR